MTDEEGGVSVSASDDSSSAWSFSFSDKVSSKEEISFAKLEFSAKESNNVRKENNNTF